MENIKIEDLKPGMQVRFKNVLDGGIFATQRYAGKVMTIRRVDVAEGTFQTKEDAHDNRGQGFDWFVSAITEIIYSESIHITRKGDTVHAVLKNGNEVVRRARADCHPDDTFDFEVGAKLAFECVLEEDKHTEEEQRESLRLLEAVQMLFPEYTYVAQDDNGDVNVFDRKPYPSSVRNFG